MFINLQNCDFFAHGKELSDFAHGSHYRAQLAVSKSCSGREGSARNRL
jgi:hypothetical protein